MKKSSEYKMDLFTHLKYFFEERIYFEVTKLNYISYSEKKIDVISSSGIN